MKPAIPIAGAFVVGLAGATFVGMRAPAAPPPPVVSATKPVVKDSAARDTVTHALDSMRPIAPDTTAALMHDDTTAAAPSTVNSAERLATIFAKLPPADIVPLTATMSDDDLLPVLKRLDVTTTAAVLALMKPARARGLSKRLLLGSAAAKP